MDKITGDLTAALEALVLPDLDVADVLAQLVSGCARTTGAAACALMARDDSGELALLAADSHRAVEMELLQIQRDTGPCVDVFGSEGSIRVSGEDALRERWGAVGEAIVGAGFAAVEAFPMRWRGTVLGGLNLFHGDAGHRTVRPSAQAYADMATLVVVQSAALDGDHVRARLHEALASRGVVEQAKGVLAYRKDVDLGEAYAILLQQARDARRPLTLTALDVIAQAVHGGPARS